MNAFKIIKLTIETYILIGLLCSVIPISACILGLIYSLIYYLAANFLATLSSLLPILS
jgi:hypothetical protein